MTSTAFAIANDSPFCESRGRMKKVEDWLLSEEAMHAPSHEIERAMMQHGQDLVRDMIQAHYARRAAQERPVTVIGADGVERDQIRIASRRVETPFGDITIERRLYQAPASTGSRRWTLRSGCRTSTTRTKFAGSRPKKRRADRSTRSPN